MARASAVALTNTLSKQYREAEDQASRTTAYAKSIFWRARMYSLAETLAQMTDDDYWWGQSHDQYDALMKEIFPGETPDYLRVVA